MINIVSEDANVLHAISIHLIHIVTSPLVVNIKTITLKSPDKHRVSHRYVQKLTLVGSNPSSAMPLMEQLHYYETFGYFTPHYCQTY